MLSNIEKIKNLSFAEKIVREKAIILDIRSQRDGIEVYLIAEFEKRNYKEFQRAFDSGAEFSLEEYGTVLYAGLGEPSDELKQELYIKFGMYEDKAA